MKFFNFLRAKETKPEPCKKELSFYQKLEDASYEDHPDDGKDETRFAVGNEFVEVLEGKTDRVSIPSFVGETVTCSHIRRGKRKLWIVGSTFNVSRKMNLSSEDKNLGGNVRRFTQTIGPGEAIGMVKLIEIIPRECENILVFEVVTSH